MIHLARVRNLEISRTDKAETAEVAKKSAESQALAVDYHPEYHPPNMKYHLISQ
jgi:gamma-glutamyl-gamma-aminobutyrate hydrolase PuuD